MKNINVQLFAEGNDYEDDSIEFEIEDLEDDFIDDSEDSEESEEDSIEDSTEDSTEDSKEEKIEKTVPLKALKAEREKFKKQINKLKSEMENMQSKKTSSEQEELFQKIAESGLDTDAVEAFKKLTEKNIDQKYVDKKFRNLEFKELAKENPDILDYQEELEGYADRTGLSVEEAYYAKFGKSKLQQSIADIERQVEQRIVASLKKKGAMKFDTTSNGEVDSTPKSKSVLSADERQIAKLAGLSEKEYALFKNVKTVDRLDKIQKKKG